MRSIFIFCLICLFIAGVIILTKHPAVVSRLAPRVRGAGEAPPSTESSPTRCDSSPRNGYGAKLFKRRQAQSSVFSSSAPDLEVERAALLLKQFYRSYKSNNYLQMESLVKKDPESAKLALKIVNYNLYIIKLTPNVDAHRFPYYDEYVTGPFLMGLYSKLESVINSVSSGAITTDDFNLFMQKYFYAYISLDAKTMNDLAQAYDKTEAAVDTLLDQALTAASPEHSHVLTRWGKGKAFDAGELVSVAASLCQARSGSEGGGISSPTFSKHQQSKVVAIWARLYNRALLCVNAIGSTQEQGSYEVEANHRLDCAEKIAKSVDMSEFLEGKNRSESLIAYTMLARAWYHQRRGENRMSDDLREKARQITGTERTWPPRPYSEVK